MKAPVSIAISLLLPGILAGCGDRQIVGRGPAKAEERKVSSAFDRISIDAPVDARISIGAGPSLRVRGYANVLPYLRTEVRGNTLHIFTDDHLDLDLRRKISADITLPRLTGLDISGASDVTVAGVVEVPEFSVDLSGAGSVDMQELHVRTFEADMSGAGDLNLRGGAIESAAYDVSGAGSIKAFGVSHRDADLDLTGASDAALTVTGRLHASISGAGSVQYKGRPAVTQEISGVGSVTQVN